MSQTSIDAGKLNQPVEILTIQESPAGTWSWQSTRPARAQVELSTRSNLFSQVGIGARGAELVLRRQALTLHQAILWGEQHLFLTAILPEGRLHLRVQAALAGGAGGVPGHPDGGHRGRGRTANHSRDHARDLPRGPDRKIRPL